MVRRCVPWSTPWRLDASATGLLGTPDDIAATAFLLGPDASCVSGTDPLVDGGVAAPGGRAASSAPPDHRPRVIPDGRPVVYQGD
jgi:hypothetical protein